MNNPWPPPPPPHGFYPPPTSRRSWTTNVVVGITCSAVGAIIAAVIATYVARNQTDTAVRAPVTVTAAPTTSQPPVPLPTAQADRQTCNAWHAAGDQMHDSTQAQSVIPPNLTILSQEVHDNPVWTAAVRKAADFYGKAADILANGITPGTTLILSQAANASVDALHTLATAYATFDPAGGNAYHVMHEASDEMDVLCERLAPK